MKSIVFSLAALLISSVSSTAQTEGDFESSNITTATIVAASFEASGYLCHSNSKRLN